METKIMQSFSRRNRAVISRILPKVSAVVPEKAPPGRRVRNFKDCFRNFSKYSSRSFFLRIPSWNSKIVAWRFFLRKSVGILPWISLQEFSNNFLRKFNQGFFSKISPIIRQNMLSRTPPRLSPGIPLNLPVRYLSEDLKKNPPASPPRFSPGIQDVSSPEDFFQDIL